MKNENEIELGVVKVIVIVVCVIIGITILFSSFYTINAGERGVLLTFGKPSIESIGEGLHVKWPIAQSVKKMDVKVLRFDAPKTGAASRDLQIVTTDVTINYKIAEDSVSTIYREIGVDYETKIIYPAVQEVVKASTALFTAEELIKRRPEAKEKIDIALRERLARSNIIVTEVSITDFDFSDAFNKAIEQKQVAEQDALAAKNKLEQIKYEADQRVVTAQAEAQALALKKLAITPELVQLSQIEVQSKALDVQKEMIAKWNGVMPATYVSGSDTSMLLNLN